MRGASGSSVTFALALALAGCGRVRVDATDGAPQGDAPEQDGGAATGGAPAHVGDASNGGAATAAGGEPSSAGKSSGSTPVESSYLPWRPGHTWLYRVTDGKRVTLKTTRVGPLEPVGGMGPHASLLANVVTTTEDDGTVTTSWQGVDAMEPERIVRFRELDFDDVGQLQKESWYEPSKSHFDGTKAHVLDGTIWTERYTETTLQVGSSPTSSEVEVYWVVIAEDARITVPAGTFTRALHLQRRGKPYIKDYWYVRGVGKVKEDGLQLEELIAYELSP